MCLDEKSPQFEASFYGAMPATFVGNSNEAVITFAGLSGTQWMEGRCGIGISNDFSLMARARLLPRDSLVELRACAPPEL
jgi:hypothetical protein